MADADGFVERFEQIARSGQRLVTALSATLDPTSPADPRALAGVVTALIEHVGTRADLLADAEAAAAIAAPTLLPASLLSTDGAEPGLTWQDLVLRLARLDEAITQANALLATTEDTVEEPEADPEPAPEDIAVPEPDDTPLGFDPLWLADVDFGPAMGEPLMDEPTSDEVFTDGSVLDHRPHADGGLAFAFDEATIDTTIPPLDTTPAPDGPVVMEADDPVDDDAPVWLQEDTPPAPALPALVGEVLSDDEPAWVVEDSFLDSSDQELLDRPDSPPWRWSLAAAYVDLQQAADAAGLDPNAVVPLGGDVTALEADAAELVFPSFFCSHKDSFLATLAWLAREDSGFELRLARLAANGSTVASAMVWPSIDPDCAQLLERLNPEQARFMTNAGTHLGMVFDAIRTAH
ncbi:MAG: hypothetical protein SF002_03000 [Alphaproteobacteria bacterium]|nr:hypothetical protein [Alphaproteobacteria bacterium]